MGHRRAGNSRSSRAASLAATSALVALSLAPLIGEASNVNLNGSGQMSYSYQFLETTSPSSTGNTYTLGIPGQYNYNDTFTSPQSTGIATSPIGQYDFMDSYVFTVGANAQGDVLTASLSLGNVFNISNLQLRLYEVTSPSVVPVVPGTPAGSTLIQPWIGTTVANPNEVMTSFSGLQNNATYILDIAGIADGTSGGSYIGTLNLAPVPLPSALWLLISGLGGACALARLRPRAHA